MSVLDGPGEGTWSVFAAKVVAERDALQDEVARLREAVSAAYLFLAPLASTGGDSLDELVKKLFAALGDGTPAIININAVRKLELYAGDPPQKEEHEGTDPEV